MGPFPVTKYPSFTVHILGDAPKSPGNYRSFGCALNINLVEGITKTMLVERVAHGFRNDAHLFLKIRAAFSGKS